MGNLVKSGSGFAMQPQSMQQAFDMATMLAKSQMVPPQYKGKPEDTLVAMMLGAELGLNPIQSLQNIAVINNRPSIYGDALAALVQNHPAFGGMDESFDDASMTATCTVWRKGGTKHTQTFSQQDATLAGLWGKTGPWKQYPKRMLAMRARGFALRNQFADALAGLITREEAEDLPPEQERDITPEPLQIEEQELFISAEQATKLREAIQLASITETAFCAKARITRLEELEAIRFEAAMNSIQARLKKMQEQAA